MKQTAIQWLQEQIEAFDPKMNTNEEYEWMFRQALEIEKEQIIDAFESYPVSVMSSDKYYDATYDNVDEITMRWKELKNKLKI